MARIVLILGGALAAAAGPAAAPAPAPRQLRGQQVNPMPNSTTCTNSYGVEFACGPNSACCGDSCLGGGSACCKSSSGSFFSCMGASSACCGDTCMQAGGTCCQNSMGGTFSCSPGSACCGDTCAKTQDKCCTDARGTKYAVSGGSPCIDEMKNCTNRHGKTFFCGKGSECCGDGCTADGAVCCEGPAGTPPYSCSQYSQCCGTVCAAPGSWCCKDERGAQYAVAATYVYPWQENKTYANCDRV